MRALKPLPTQRAELAGNEAVPHLTSRAGREPLGALESLVLSKVNGRRTVEDLAAMVGVTPTELATMLSHLLELGMVHLDAPSSHASGIMPAQRGDDPGPERS
ncbi:MAG: hypothetical protein ACXVEE_39005 [Polyangiales bacterium]